MAQQMAVDFTNKNANNIKSDSTTSSQIRNNMTLANQKRMKINNDDFNNDHILQHILTIKTRGNFLWRLWFLISAPIIWLIKGTIKIK
jgi:hypothetical protein